MKPLGTFTPPPSPATLTGLAVVLAAMAIPAMAQVPIAGTSAAQTGDCPGVKGTLQYIESKTMQAFTGGAVGLEITPPPTPGWPVWPPHWWQWC